MIRFLFHCLKTDREFKQGSVSTDDLRGVWNALQKEPFYKVVQFIHYFTDKQKEDIVRGLLFGDN